jgi:hypothetical protein
VFPLDNRAAVCAFEVEIDGKVTKGEVQEKEQARATYDAAVASGQGAQLLEQKRADIFQMSVGNLLPRQLCAVSITYVAELPVAGDAVKFFLPTFVAPRYHTASEHDPLPDAGGPITHFPKNAEGLTISVAATMAAAITAVVSPTHAITVTHAAGEATALITLAGPATHLDKDFELLVRCCCLLFVVVCLFACLFVCLFVCLCVSFCACVFVYCFGGFVLPPVVIHNPAQSP